MIVLEVRMHVKNRSGELVDLIYSGRHFGLSTIVITQQFTSVVKCYRDNSDKIVTFFNASKKDRKTMLKEYLEIDEKEEKEINSRLKNIKYARLEIMTVSPYTHRVVIPQF